MVQRMKGGDERGRDGAAYLLVFVLRFDGQLPGSY
ncbi:hypothetical protein BH23ACT9_BH23ACT9_10860 [soil metagenome]